jgi:hypothetical protein
VRLKNCRRYWIGMSTSVCQKHSRARGIGNLLCTRSGLLRLAIPAAVALARLKLEDAYATPPPAPILQAMFSFSVVCLSQAALVATDPRWVLPMRIMIYGGAIGTVLASTLRMRAVSDIRVEM